MARKKIKKASPSSSLDCLPDEIVLDLLVRVPRRYYENIASVSKRLRSLVRSPELHRMRSLLHKDPIYLCLREWENYADPRFYWFTLRQTNTAEYKLVPIPFPDRFFMCRCSTGKIYVTQELENGSIQEEVLDLESETWKVPGVPVPKEKVDNRPMVKSCVTLEGKVYALNIGRITVYNLRQGRKEKLDMPIGDMVWHMCLADDLLFAFFTRRGLMWLDTRTNVWRAVSGDVQTLHKNLYCGSMAQHYGKLALFWGESRIWCALIALTKVGEEVRGEIEWSGVVATLPYVCSFKHCLVASD